MWVDDLRHLVCPDCRGPLRWAGVNLELEVREGTLTCDACQVEWLARDGWIRFYRERQVRQRDRLVCRLCDRFPLFHDPVMNLLVPAVQGGGSVDGLRRDAAAMADLSDLAPAGEVPRRVLNVGLGTGRHVADLLRVLPPHVELWGTDLSVGMLALARHRFLRDPRQRAVRLLLADAHRLPFPDGFFDRVLHLGGTGGVRDPKPALAEMARVARPGAPVVVVIERLEGGGPLRRWAFGRIADPHSALEALPAGATDVQTRQLSPFYAGVRFRAA